MEKKYQYSIKMENGEIIVVRSDDFDELKLDIEQVRTYLNGQKRRAEIESIPIERELEEPHTNEVEPESYCNLHKVQMKEVRGKYGIFYSHGRKLPNGNWDNCVGRGYKSEL